MNKIDILWLLEHKVREMDMICAVKSLTRLIMERYPYTVTRSKFSAGSPVANFSPNNEI